MTRSQPPQIHPKLVGIVDSWRAAISNSKKLPSHVAFSVIVRGFANVSFFAKVEGESVRFISIGADLTERLGYSLEGQIVALDSAELFGSLQTAYRQAIENHAPCYDYLRLAIADGMFESFERLTLPFVDIFSSEMYVGGVVLFRQSGSDRDA